MASSKKGKAIAAKNATKHGIYSQKPPTTDDRDYELFESTKAALNAEFEPQTISEEIQIEQIVMARVRLHRLWRSEAASVQAQKTRARKRVIEPQPTYSNPLSHLFGDEPEVPPAIQKELNKLEKILGELEPEEKSIIYSDDYQKRLQREEGHLQRIIDKGLKYLQEQRDRRNGANPQTVDIELN